MGTRLKTGLYSSVKAVGKAPAPSPGVYLKTGEEKGYVVEGGAAKGGSCVEI